jgi:ankyrin repeat protein
LGGFGAGDAAKVATLLAAQDLESFLNYQNKSTFTALHAATANNDLDVTRLLIEAVCNVNVTTDFGRTPLMTVAQYGYTSIAKELIAARCNVDLPQHDWDTRLYMAAFFGNAEHSQNCCSATFNQLRSLSS